MPPAHTSSSNCSPPPISSRCAKAADGALIGSGLRGGEGAVDWLDPDDLRLRKRIRAGKTTRGVLLTQEGMAIAGDRIYFVPDDGPSRVLVYRLPW